MPRAQSSDGVIHDFPEGTDPAVIDRVMKDYATRKGAPQTTAGGLAAAAGRGLAPIAAGAGIGAAIGAPFAGVGAVPGAIAGAGAAGLAEAGTGLYNLAARPLGLPQVGTPQAATDKLLDALGIKRPGTPAERLTESVTGDIAIAATGMMPTKGLADAIASGSAPAAEKSIQSLYSRAVKPSVAGKGTAGAVERYNDQARGAIDSIVSNKARLTFDNGAITGELPKSLDEFSQAIAQTKAGIFQQYDALAGAAGDKGAVVPLKPVADELMKFAAQPGIQDTRPAIGEYAKALAARLSSRGAYGVAEAQEAVHHLNESLKGFYRSPTYESGSQAAVDAIVAHQLRKSLDTVIESAGQPGYQALRDQYRNLKVIEEHVTKAAQRVAKQDPGGGIIGALGTLATAEEAARFAVSGDLQALASGGAIRAATSYYRWLRNPNRAVEKLFETAERQRQ